ncbi:MAG: hypothetical protein RI964_1371 [Pseudomonadota bacterium]|jgi:phosphoglycerol transferase MdoB-like AlkP superfamily enzyme
MLKNRMFASWKHWVYLILFSLLLLILSRIGLMVWYHQPVSTEHGWWIMLLQGLRVDIATLSWLFGIPAAFTLLLGSQRGLGKVWLIIMRIWLTIALCALAFMEVATPGFLMEYGVRPNHIFVEYLIYPKEVSNTLWLGHKAELLAGFVVGTLALVFGWRLAGKCVHDLRFPPWQWRPVLAVLVLLAAVMGARSTFGHRALNPAMVAFSTNATVNSLVTNSTYSLLFAVDQMLAESGESSRMYGALPDTKVVDIVRQASGRPASAFISEVLPTLSHNAATYQGKPKNIVILLQESFGAQYVGTLGGLPLSPNIDRLAKQGWLFENLYATGTRSVRGIEAVVTGFTPTPAQAVVKLNKSQSGFFTLAELLAQRGYTTQFIYGGESHFDNMRSFFLGNGFQEIVEQKDYTNPAFTGSWGVSDEDLMQRADTEFKRLHATGKPFFSLVFSSSNHDPFQFPDGRIELHEQPKQTRNNAVKYADYAIGKFFDLAQQADYWQDTLFLIVADHDSRVTGDGLVPVARFHIPAVIIGDGLPAKRDSRVVSQIDMPPTLLSLAGVTADYPMLGRDLTQTPVDWAGRALMQYDKNFAYMQGNQVTVLQAGKPAAGFIYDTQQQKLVPAAAPTAVQAQEALAHVLWGDMAYSKGLYALPKLSK